MERLFSAALACLLALALVIGLTAAGASVGWIGKGDLLAGTTSGTLSRLPVGPDGQRLTADSTQPLGLKWAPAGGAAVFNAEDFGADHNALTDDTAAIQAALDAAGQARGTVLVPASSVVYAITNLKVPAYVKFLGQGMQSTMLQRITGSTGTAIREKTIAEGNPYGATSIVLSDFTLFGSGTAGNGIDIGNANGGLWNLSSMGTISRVLSTGFPSGIAININSNAEMFSYLWGHASKDGINLVGGANQYYALYAESNTRYQMNVLDGWSSFFGIQIEMGAESSADPAIRVVGVSNSLNGVFINHSGPVLKPSLISNVSGANRNEYRGVTIVGTGAFTHGIKHEAWGKGTGQHHNIHEFVIGEGSDDSSWYINGSSGRMWRRAADQGVPVEVP